MNQWINESVVQSGEWVSEQFLNGTSEQYSRSVNKEYKCDRHITDILMCKQHFL